VILYRGKSGIENDFKSQIPDMGIYGGGIMELIDRFFDWLILSKEDSLFESISKSKKS
jgi:hypothetical protein